MTQKLLNRDAIGKTYHPLREQIIRTIDASEEQEMSPTALAAVLDEPLGNVSYHTKTLREVGAVELTKTEPRRGAVEHFYAVADGVLVDPEGESAALQRIAALMPAGTEGKGLLGKVVEILAEVGYQPGKTKTAV